MDYIYNSMNIRLRTILQSQLCSPRQSQKAISSLSEDSPHSLHSETPVTISSKYRLFSLERLQGVEREVRAEKYDLSRIGRRSTVEEVRSDRFEDMRSNSVLTHSQVVCQKGEGKQMARKRLKTEVKKPFKAVINKRFETSQELSESRMLKKTLRCQKTKKQSGGGQGGEVFDSILESEDEVRFLPEIRHNRPVNRFRKSTILSRDILKKYLEDKNQQSHRGRLLLNKFRICVNAVLFTIHLRKFSSRLRVKRKEHFLHFLKHSLLVGLQALKAELLECSRPFLNQVALTLSDLRLHSSDSDLLAKQKLRVARELMVLQVECLQRVMQKQSKDKLYGDLLYLLCGHGSFSCNYSIFTAQQMNWLCISPQQGYLCSNWQLQQSTLLLLVLLKLLIFNILLQPHTLQSTGSINLRLISSNLTFLANIMYALLVDIHDNLLQNLPPSYPLGNWRESRDARAADSMTVVEGYVQESQLISGLKSRKYMLNLAGEDFRRWFRSRILGILQKLQGMMSRYHHLISG